MGRRRRGRQYEERVKEAARIQRIRKNIIKGRVPYDCPMCGDRSFWLKHVKGGVRGKCMSCGFEYTVPFMKSPALEAIDYYNKICDIVRAKEVK